MNDNYLNIVEDSVYYVMEIEPKISLDKINQILFLANIEHYIIADRFIFYDLLMDDTFTLYTKDIEYYWYKTFVYKPSFGNREYKYLSESDKKVIKSVVLRNSLDYIVKIPTKIEMV